MVPSLLSRVFTCELSGCRVTLVRKLLAMNRYIPRGINPNTNLITFDIKNSDGDIVNDDQLLVNPPCNNKHRQLPC